MATAHNYTVTHQSGARGRVYAEGVEDAIARYRRRYAQPVGICHAHIETAEEARAAEAAEANANAGRLWHSIRQD